MQLEVPSELEVEPLEVPWVVQLELVERRQERVLVLVVALVAKRVAESAAE